jgi:heavy metal translocating P-type ATPase
VTAGASPVAWSAERAAGAVETGLFLDGLRCAGCVARVERALRGIAGVESANVNHTTHRALVRYDPGRVGVDLLVARVRELGYDATPFDPEALERPSTRSAREALVRVLVAGFLAANVMMLAVALYIGSYQGIEAGVQQALRWTALALSLPAATWCAAPFWRGAWSGLRHGELTVDVPIALGIATAFTAGVLGTLERAHHVFVDSAATIVFLVLLGRTLERGARARASGAVERLVALAPARAWRRAASGMEEVLARTLRAGDRVVVPPGQAFPADGVICAGETEVDEALLSGESRPVARRPGDGVTGGSRNVLAEVEVEVRAAQSEGTLARMAGLLERAQAERPRVQRLADRVAAVFAPAVLTVAALTAIGWRLAGASWLDVAMTASAVLIVACPCALALATPAAMAAAIGRAASLGVLFKSGEAIERCAGVDTVLLDKTGTVTEARLAVEAVAAAPGCDADRVVARAAAAEGRSTHPLAAAIRAEAERRGIDPDGGGVTTRKVEAGLGVVAAGEGVALAVGSRELLDALGARLPPLLEHFAEGQAAQGASLAYVAEEGRATGVIAFSDPPREDAAQAVAALRRLGCSVALVSGDHEGATARAGARAGIDDVRPRSSPSDKVAGVAARRAGGGRVLFAGDGINDAAALAAADVGLAIGRGADVAVHAADAVVLAPRLTAVADAIALSRSALRRVRENLFLAVLYNAAAVPLAAAGRIDPLVGAVAMSLSSLVVTGNAVRLLRWRPRR